VAAGAATDTSAMRTASEVFGNMICDGLSNVIGKTITHVATCVGSSGPKQLYLVFSDGTMYELFLGDCGLGGASGLDRGGVDRLIATARRHRRNVEVIGRTPGTRISGSIGAA
jgi:hypothetical protein